MKIKLDYIIVILITLILFRLAVDYALLERGYKAYGGEYLTLLIPILYYSIKTTILDIIEEFKKGGERDE